jgi:hypothetical protein
MKSDELKLIPPLNQNGLKLVLDPLMLQPKDSISAVQGLNAAEGDAVVIVDTFSTGALLANMLYKMKFKVLNEYFFLILFYYNYCMEGLIVFFKNVNCICNAYIHVFVSNSNLNLAGDNHR